VIAYTLLHVVLFTAGGFVQRLVHAGECTGGRSAGRGKEGEEKEKEGSR